MVKTTNKKCLDCNNLINTRATRCRICNNKHLSRIRTNKNIDHSIQGLKERKKKLNHIWYEKNKSDIKKRIKSNYEKDRLKVKIQNSRWREENKIKHNEYMKKYISEWKKINKQKVNAQNLARRRVPLKERCEICGSIKNLQRHHPDYNKPLFVWTLCKFYHECQHKKRLIIGGDI